MKHISFHLVSLLLILPFAAALALADPFTSMASPGVSPGVSPGTPCQPESREYKLLLLPAGFGDPLDGMLRYWKTAEAVAQKMKLKVKAEKHPKLEPSRFVTYIDTPGYDLKKKGFILRRRSKKPFTSQKWDMVLKARSKNPDTAAEAPVAPQEGLGGAVSFEEDVSLSHIDGRINAVRLYSRSGECRVPIVHGENLSAFAKLFPGLATLGIPAYETLMTVRGLIIREYRLKPGKIDLGPVKAAVTLTVWRVEGENKPWVAEFSFDHNLTGIDSRDALAGNTALEFLSALAEKTSGQLAKGVTKTSLVYGESRLR